jgi:hypothetical protein
MNTRTLCLLILGSLLLLVAMTLQSATPQPPVITTQPKSATLKAGADIDLSVSAVGTDPRTCQWQLNGAPIPGAVANKLQLRGVKPAQSGTYSVVVSNPYGQVRSADAILSVQPFFITKQPESDAVRVQSDVAFKVGVSGKNPFQYQWQFNGVAIPGATAEQLTLEKVQPAQTGSYSVVISNPYGTLVSAEAALTVFDPPTITAQPQSQTVALGSDVVLSVTATGVPAPSYRWALNGDYIPGETSSTLTLKNVQSVDGGSYSVTVLNDWGAVDSVPVEVQVVGPVLGFADRFANRGLINTFSGEGRGSNVGATKEGGEPLHAGKKGERSVWLSWVAPANGIAKFSTAGSTFDTLLAVYTGSAVNALTSVASDDEAGGYHTSEVEFNAEAGGRYEIAVDGFNRAVGTILLTWQLTPSDQPLPILTQIPQSVTANLGAMVALSVNYLSYGPVAIQWLFEGQEIPGATAAVLTLQNLQPGQVGRYQARLTEDGLSILTPPAEVQINTEGLANVRACNRQGDAASGSTTLSGQALMPGPSTRKLALSGLHRVQDLAPVRGYTGTQIFSTTPGKDPGEPNICGVVGGASYWLSYQPPATGILSLNTDGSTFDTLLGVYVDDGRNLGYASLVSVSCDNNSGANGKTSALSCQVAAGQTYYIVVDGVNGATGIVYLNYNLNTPPTISQIPDQTINEDTSTPSLSFTVADRETPAGSLILTASSANQALVPNGNITFGGSGNYRTVTVKPNLYRDGVAAITVTVTDGGRVTATDTFVLTVRHVNHPPVANSDSVTRVAGKALKIWSPVLLTNDRDVDGDTLTLSGVASRSVYGGTVSKSGTDVYYYPPAGFNATDYFTYTVSDGHGGTATGNVTVSVSSSGTSGYYSSSYGLINYGVCSF